MFCTFVLFKGQDFYMIYYLKKYPISIMVILIVIYLSFFRPPSVDIASNIPHLDKIVHICMYLGISLVLWWEFLRNHKVNASFHRAWIGACLVPILFSGAVELLQEYCTSYRGGDWMDFVANSVGAILGSLIGFYLLRPRMVKLESYIKGVFNLKK